MRGDKISKELLPLLFKPFPIAIGRSEHDPPRRREVKRKEGLKFPKSSYIVFLIY